MKHSSRSEPENLDEWLDIATRVLAESARQRIRPEIEGHYAEAVAAHLAEGLSESVAQERALAELGDPLIASVRFSKSHPSKWEIKFLTQSLNRKRMRLFLIVNYFVFLCCGISDVAGAAIWRNNTSSGSHLTREGYFLIWQFLVLIVLPTVSFVMAKDRNARGRVPLILFLETFSGMPMYIFLIVLFDSKSSLALRWITLGGLCLYFLCGLLNLFRLSKKNSARLASATSSL